MSRASGKPNGVFQRRNDTMEREREREKWKRGKISKYTKKLSTHLLMVAIYSLANFPGIGEKVPD